MKLSDKDCQSCKGSIAALTESQIGDFLKQVSSAWEIIDKYKLRRCFQFKNFKDALHFTNRLGALAERQNHHPDILLKWGVVEVDIFTHKIKDLTENDFILAAKCDELFN